MRIFVRKDVCSGCRACEVACVAAHEGGFGRERRRITVVKAESEGVDEPVVCRQCGRPLCVPACPAGALIVDEATGSILLRSEACTGCQACAEACPFGAIALDLPSGLPLICDLCQGDPACVKRCATGAIALSSRGPVGRAAWD